MGDAFDPTQPVCREMTWAELQWDRIKRSFVRLRRKLPFLVWYDDELDVTVTFSEHGLKEGSDINDALRYLYRSRMAEIEKALSEIEIGFDRGGGFEGRDWEWDWSLSGPISIRFRSRSQRPERRRARPRPCLVYSAPPDGRGTG